jgi:short-subunit dehydrogenase involved in D-alanine esterification of teichoic acids
MSFPYKHVLLIGATAGIGRAMADRFIETGIKVTAVGRRQERLDEFVRKHGEDKASGVAFDISDISKTPAFAESVMKSYPGIDCLFLNAGIQNAYDLSDPASFDLERFQNETHVNYISLVALVHAFLPVFREKDTPTSIIFTGTNIAIIPAATLPAYCGSKAALNVFTLCLRENLGNTKIKIIEISPPPVQTELHDYMGENGRSFGMPVDQFTDAAHRGLLEGKDQIVIGAVGPAETFNEIVDKRRDAFENFAKLMRSAH